MHDAQLVVCYCFTLSHEKKKQTSNNIVNECSALRNGSKLHDHMEWNKSNRPFSFC